MIPYVVIVQSARFNASRRRVVVPLLRTSEIGESHHSRANPTFTVEGTSARLTPLEIVSVAVDELGERVGSLVEHSTTIINALDELITRAYG